MTDVKNKTSAAAMVRLGVILALYAAAACVGLAFVYSGTEQIIARRQEADQNAALGELFPGADRFSEINGSISSADPSVVFEAEYAAHRGNGIAGVVLRTSRASYGGAIKILVGISADGKITGIKILEHQDTPGLGANAASPSYYVDRAAGIHFYDQFAGKSAGDQFAVKSDVAAITAATITSRAVADSVKAAGLAAAGWLSREGQSER
jgi:electron transport complex protein RnfG